MINYSFDPDGPMFVGHNGVNFISDIWFERAIQLDDYPEAGIGVDLDVDRIPQDLYGQQFELGVEVHPNTGTTSRLSSFRYTYDQDEYEYKIYVASRPVMDRNNIVISPTDTGVTVNIALDTTTANRLDLQDVVFNDNFYDLNPVVDGPNNMRMDIAIHPNTGTTSVTNHITFKFAFRNDPDRKIVEEVTFVVIQDGIKNKLCSPIWKDTFYARSINGDYLNYQLRIGDSVIYSGRAYKLPGSDNVSIKVNDICRNYIQAKCNFNTEVQYIPNSYVIFDLYTMQDGDDDYELAEQYGFYNDWSYENNGLEYSEGGIVSVANMPINTSLPPFAAVPFTYLFTNGRTVNPAFVDIEAQDGYLLKEFNITTPGYYDIFVYNDIEPGYEITEMHSTSDDPTYDTYTFDNCKANYCLYYRNGLGGMDVLPLSGKVIRSGRYTRNPIYRDFNNNDRKNFNKQDYQCDYIYSWKVNTGYLSADKSDLMENVFRSNEVYLMDENRVITAVNVETMNIDFKTLKNNAHKLIYYQFTVSQSQEFINQ